MASSHGIISSSQGGSARRSLRSRPLSASLPPPARYSPPPLSPCLLVRSAALEDRRRRGPTATIRFLFVAEPIAINRPNRSFRPESFPVRVSSRYRRPDVVDNSWRWPDPRSIKYRFGYPLRGVILHVEETDRFRRDVSFRETYSPRRGEIFR